MVAVSSLALRRSSNIENLSPHSSQHHLKSAGNTTGDVSLRRRARLTSGSHSRTLMERPTTPVTPKVTLPTPPASPHEVQVNIPTQQMSLGLTLPRVLQRPAMRPVSKSAVVANEPSYEDMPLYMIRADLQMKGADFLKVLSNIQTKPQPQPSALPAEIIAIANDLSAQMPTHMFAVWDQGAASDGQRKRGTLYPAHSAVFAAYSSAFHDKLPKSSPQTPDAPGSPITLPIVPLRLPHPESFPILTNFLYTHRSDVLFHSLIPTPPPTSEASSSREELVEKYAARLAAALDVPHALHLVMTINGLWRNVCTLGIYDNALWGVMDLCWEVAIATLGRSVNIQ